MKRCCQLGSLQYLAHATLAADSRTIAPFWLRQQLDLWHGIPVLVSFVGPVLRAHRDGLHDHFSQSPPFSRFTPRFPTRASSSSAACSRGSAVCSSSLRNPGKLIPLGPNYEAVREALSQPRRSGELLVFAFTKLLGTLYPLGLGGVSAMFVPLVLAGGVIGSAFAQSIVHTPTFDLYAAVGMGSFIAAGYKAPLTPVVAETTGIHSSSRP
jgi:hypothetical protein